MIFSFPSRIVSSLAAFLYPGYATYKTLSQRPASEPELERWLMYWSVLGCIVGVEYLAEWLVSWIPLYTTMKAIFLLYLALPQTQGATYIYTAHLRPFFATHEQQIDRAIAEVRGRAYRFLQEKARTLWQAAVGALAPGGEGAAGPGSMGQTQPPPTMSNPAGGPTQLLSSLWTSYGPGIIAGGAALLSKTAAATLPAGGPGAAAAGQPTLNTPPGSGFFHPNAPSGTIDPVERRRQLEAELAALSAISANPQPIPPMNNPARRPSLASMTPSSSSSESGVRERTISGRFEEIRGGDVEGYEIDDDDFAGAPHDGRPAAGRNSSWFGGWGSSSGKDGYERVKGE